MKLNTKQALSKIETWLDKKGFVLCKSKNRTIEDEVDFERKVVFLSLRSKPIYQVYSILHECGHVIIRGRKSYKEDFKSHIEVCENGARPTFRSSIEEVEEEINAWREGERLAKKLSIELDREEYYKYSSKWVMGYIVLASLGRESVLPIAKDSEKIEEDVKEKGIKIDLCRLLDNAHPVCYDEVIAKPKP